MIYPVDDSNLESAAKVHSISWKDSHQSFCSPGRSWSAIPRSAKGSIYGARSTSGARFFLLVEAEAIGVVSVTENLIEDLYFLPEYQGRGMARSCSALPWPLAQEDQASGSLKATPERAACTSGRASA